MLEELLSAGAPVGAHWIADRQTAPLILRYGSQAQRDFYLPRIIRGEAFFAIVMSEPDTGSDLASVRTRATPQGGGWLLNGRKIWTTNAHRSHYMCALVRTSGAPEDRHRGLSQMIFDLTLPGIEIRPIRDITGDTHFCEVLFDNVRLPADALVGSEDAAIAQLFAGLNPERIMGSAMAVGTGRLAITKATDYLKTRQVWKVPIGSHQGLSHPLAQTHIEVELAKLMMQKAATLYDAGDDFGAAEAANMAKYAAGEASVRAVDQAVQSLGGNGLTKEYGIAAAVTASRLARIAPVSREMILNFVAQTSLGLPRSY